MQQLDLFGFPIETPAPKKKEKAVKAGDVQPTPVPAETKTVTATAPVVAEEKAGALTVLQEEISTPAVPEIREEAVPVAAIEETIAPVAVEEKTTEAPKEYKIVVPAVIEEQTIEAPKEEKVVAPVVAEEKTIEVSKQEKIIAPVAAEQPVVKTVAKEKVPAKKTTATVNKQAGKRGRKSFKEMDSEADLIEVPADEILHQKLYYSISEVAGWFKVNTSLLRYWENEFDVLQPRKTRKGDRLFRVEDIKNLQLIYFLLRQRKFSIDGAKNYLKNNKQEADTQIRLVESLTRFRSFLLEMKANLQA